MQVQGGYIIVLVAQLKLCQVFYHLFVNGERCGAVLVERVNLLDVLDRPVEVIRVDLIGESEVVFRLRLSWKRLRDCGIIK